MDTLIFSDLHAHAWGEFSSLVEYRGALLNSRLVDAAKVIDRARKLVRRDGYRRVIFGGDLFHRKRLIDVPVFNVVAEAMWRLADAAERVFVLAGNHDLARRSGEGEFTHEHALFALSGHAKIKVIDQPFTCDGMGFVPYGSDRETVLRGCEGVSGASALVMHVGVAGAATGPIEYLPLEPVAPSDLPSVPIYSGHYHGPQTVGQVTYIGAPLEYVRGDGVYKQGPRGMMKCRWGQGGGMRIAHRGPRFVDARYADGLPSDVVAGQFVDLEVEPDTPVAAQVAACLEAGARGVVPTLIESARQVVTSRLGVPVAAGGVPSIAALCDAYAKRHAPKGQRKAYRAFAQAALAEAEAASTAGPT